MNIIDRIKDKARKNIKTIVLPEANDIRTLKAARIISDEKFAKVILVGDKKTILNVSTSNQIDISDIELIDPKTYF